MGTVVSEAASWLDASQSRHSSRVGSSRKSGGSVIGFVVGSIVGCIVGCTVGFIVGSTLSLLPLQLGDIRSSNASNISSMRFELFIFASLTPSQPPPTRGRSFVAYESTQRAMMTFMMIDTPARAPSASA
jgi:hypothetical protein